MRCDVTALMNCIRFETTDGNFDTREKVALPIPTVTCTRIPFPVTVLAYLCSNSHGISVEFPWELESRSHADL